jgi:hypothetical protein
VAAVAQRPKRTMFSSSHRLLLRKTIVREEFPVIREQSADEQRAEHQNTKSQFTSDSAEGRITH